jgi:hypothetical protein
MRKSKATDSSVMSSQTGFSQGINRILMDQQSSANFFAILSQQLMHNTAHLADADLRPVLNLILLSL